MYMCCLLSSGFDTVPTSPVLCAGEFLQTSYVFHQNWHSFFLSAMFPYCCADENSMLRQSLTQLICVVYYSNCILIYHPGFTMLGLPMLVSRETTFNNSMHCQISWENFRKMCPFLRNSDSFSNPLIIA